MKYDRYYAVKLEYNFATAIARYWLADSDESGHLFRFISDTLPGLSDSCRSEATLWRKS